MPFWNLFRKPTVDASRCTEYADMLQLVAHARVELSSKPITNTVNVHGDQMLDEPNEPRTSYLVGELLGSLWRNDAVVLLLIHDTLIRHPQQDVIRAITSGIVPAQACVDKELLLIASMMRPAAAALPEAYFMIELQAFTRKQTPSCPEIAEARYDAVIAGLRACLRHNLQEVRQTDEIFPLTYLFDCLKIASRLCAHEYLHDVYCEMLITIQQAIVAERDGPRVARLESLRRELYTFVFLSAHTKPLFWQMLKDTTTSEVFWPVVDMMRSNWLSHLVPPLLDTLPFLLDNGKAHVIAALRDIGDVSALPALQQLAQDKKLVVAPLAAKAVKSLLRRNKSDAAQLLRAADMQYAVNAGETLLRSAEGGSYPTPQEELLRPDLTPGPSPDRATR